MTNIRCNCTTCSGINYCDTTIQYGCYIESRRCAEDGCLNYGCVNEKIYDLAVSINVY